MFLFFLFQLINRYYLVGLCTLLMALLLTCCQKGTGSGTATKPLFDSVPVVSNVAPLISEVSGIADSKKNSGYLWAQEDGGNPTQLYLIKHDGTVQKKIFIKGVINRDWEDMSLTNGNIYLGEIGDNNAAYPEYLFYKFPEPAMAVDTITAVETIRFIYPDGAHDAEAFLIEPSTNAIYIITKRDSPSRIYKLTPPFSASVVYTAQAVGQLPYNGVVSAALSADAKEIIIKTYFGLNYYKIASGETVEAALQKTPAAIPYTVEPQGEAVCFSTANNGYFTLSEKGLGASVQLYFYKRN